MNPSQSIFDSKIMNLLPTFPRALLLAGSFSLCASASGGTEQDHSFDSAAQRAISGMRDYLPNHPASQAPDKLKDACLQSSRRTPELDTCLEGIASRYGVNFTLKPLRLSATTGSEGSVGMLLDRDAEGFVVTGVLLGQSAARAGVRSGERIVRLDGTDVSGLAKTADLVKKIRGPVGSQVKLGLANWLGDIREVVLTRTPTGEQGLAFAVSESDPGVCVPTPQDRVFSNTPRDLKAWKEARLMLFMGKNGIGACDAKGKVVIPPRFQEIVPNGATALVTERGEQSGIMRHDGTWLRAPDKNRKYSVWAEAKRYLMIGKEITILDGNGAPCIKEGFQSIVPRDAYAIVGIPRGAERVIDANGKVLLEAGKNEMLKWFDYQGESRLLARPLWIDRRVEGENGESLHGLFDVKSRRTILEPRYRDISFNEAFDAFVVEDSDKQLAALHAADGRQLIPPRYDSISLPAKDDRLQASERWPLDIVVVSQGEKQRLFSISRQAEIGPLFDSIRIGRRGVRELRALVAQNNGRWGVIGLDGKTLVDFDYEDPEEEIDAFGYIAVTRASGEPRKRVLAVPPEVASNIEKRLMALRTKPPQQIADGAPLLGLVQPEVEFSARYAPVVFASDEGVKRAYAEGALFEPFLPSLLVTGNEAYSGLGNIRSINKPAMPNVGPVCRTATGFEYLYDGPRSDEDIAAACRGDARRLTFTRHEQGWRCENCGAFGIPSDWIELPLR